MRQSFSPGDPPRVAVVLHGDTDYHRAVLTGLAAATRDRGWRLRRVRAGHWLGVELDRGCIGAVVVDGDGQVFARLRRRRVPAVDLRRDGAPCTGASAVRLDHHAAGTMAAEHLLARGHRSLAFVGMAQGWAAACRTGFTRRAEAAGARVVAVASGSRHPLRGERKLRDWVLAAADGPAVGVGVCCMDRARLLDEVVTDLLPERRGHLALVGVGPEAPAPGDEGEAVTTVGFAVHEPGASALAMLADGARGPVCLAPCAVTVRHSSAGMHADDPLLIAALTHFDGAMQTGIDCGGLARALGVNRRTLERHARAQWGRPLAGVLRRLRLERVAELLARTSEPMRAIAAAAGFATTQHLAEVFRRNYGMTPSAYRSSS